MPDIQVFCYSQDDWYPSYFVDLEGYRRLVNVMMSASGPAPGKGNGYWFVQVSGSDDHCMVKPFGRSRKEAWECFVEVIKMPYVNKQPLLDKGFVYG